MAKPLLCEPALFLKDLTGKVVIVTGANSGIGWETTKQLAAQGAHVVMACRRIEAGQERIDELTADVPNASLSVLPLDLSKLASVRAFADAFLKAHDRLDVLINNAGIMNTDEGRTEDGFELQIGTNHMGHFLLTELLLDVLKQSAPSRIVCVSSCYHDAAQGKPGVIRFDDLNFDNEKYNGWAAYSQSKLANVMHAKALAKELDGTGVTAVSVHPGWVRTDLARHTMPLWVQNTIAKPVLRWMGMIEPHEGAHTSLHAALADDVPEHAGSFYSQRGIYQDKSNNAGGWPMRSPSPQAHDADAIARFYTLSRQAVGL